MQHVMETENKAVVENGVAGGASADPPVESQAVAENNDSLLLVRLSPPPDTPSEETPADTPVQNGTHADNAEDNDDNADSKSYQVRGHVSDQPRG